MKKIQKIVVISILFVLSALLVACSGADGILFEEEPRTTYIQGQEFTLDDSVLVLLSGNKKEPIDLTQVTVTGYDKDTLGEQTVTVTYDKFSITLTVNVIARMSFEGLVSDYFVGDSFDKTKGRIKIANDDGSFTTVNMSNEGVTVEGFDSGAAATGKTITVKYGEFSGSFTVNVYAAENVELTAKPKKNSYYSHETEFSTLGAYFTVTANNGALSRMVELNEEMISGFDPSMATAENTETPLNQTVKITYLGHEFDFPITIRYSAVTLMQETAEAMKNVTPETATAEQGQEALLTLQKFMDLSKSEQALVDENTRDQVLLIALHYGFREYTKEVESYSGSFSISGREDADGNPKAVFTVLASDREILAKDLERLKDDSQPINRLADTLRTVRDEFGDVMVTETENVRKYLDTVYDEDARELIIDMFDMMIELYQHLTVIPDNWTVEELDDYKDAIKDAVITIANAGFNPYTEASYATLYDTVSSWREKNDFLEIIHSYYMEYEADTYLDTVWEKIPLPSKLQALYRTFSYGAAIADSMKVGTDTTAFMSCYREAKRLSEEIKQGENEIQLKIYQNLNFDYLMINYFTAGSNVNGVAYAYHASYLLGNPHYEELLEKYLGILVDVMADEDYYASAENQKKVQELYEMYIDFTPAEQYAFLCSLQCDYRFTALDELILSHKINEEGKLTSYNWFGVIILNSYRQKLSEEGFDVFARLFESTELYAIRYRDPANLEKFMTEMEEIMQEFAKLPASDRESFDFALNKFTMLYNECKASTLPTLSSEDQKTLDELKSVIEVFYEISYYTSSDGLETAEKTRYYAVMFAAHEKARALSAEILASDNENLINAFLYGMYTFHTDYVDDDSETNSVCTFDFIVEELSSFFYYMHIRSEVEVEYADGDASIYNAFYLYYYTDISGFFEKAYDLLLAEYKGTATELPMEYVLSVMQEYRALSDSGVFAIHCFQADGFYFNGVQHCIGNSVKDPAALEWVKALLTAEETYASCAGRPDNEKAMNEFQSQMEALMSDYSQLADKTAVADYEEMYAYYVEKYNSISDGELTPEAQ